MNDISAVSFPRPLCLEIKTENIFCFSYDEVFPALPQNMTPTSAVPNQLGQWNNKMRIGSSTVTQVSFRPTNSTVDFCTVVKMCDGFFRFLSYRLKIGS